MDRYIGLDDHSSSCTLGMLGPGGKRLGSHVVETNVKALIEVLRSIPGPPGPGGPDRVRQVSRVGLGILEGEDAFPNPLRLLGSSPRVRAEVYEVRGRGAPIQDEIDRARPVVAIQDFSHVRPPSCERENAPLLVRSVRMAERGYVVYDRNISSTARRNAGA